MKADLPIKDPVNLCAPESVYTIGLTGGGTAGHVWPHFALFDNPDSILAQHWKAGSLRVVYFGGETGMERELVSQVMGDRWIYVSLKTGKLRRYFDLRNFTDPLRIVWAVAQSLHHLRRNRVQVLFSKGGFVSAPVVWAAWLLRIPVVIHESDVTPALATRLTFPFAKYALTAFAQTQRLLSRGHRSAHNRIQCLGLPLRVSLFSGERNEALRRFGLEREDEKKKPVLLVFGGSLGAEILNLNVRHALPKLLEHFCVLHIVGKGKTFSPPEGSIDRGYRQFEFLGAEMKDAYAVADLALCRAGASSLFELAAARIPMLLVPLDLNQSRGDQIVNAQVFVDAGWAAVLREADLDPDRLVHACVQLESNREQIRLKLQNAPGPQSAVDVAEVIWSCFPVSVKAGQL
jgi:UDP-N-acetylglucosamine--N-acetylmuramyl-(pentapeptide) pyrophosphoryl-undecaprenol N-acetylglucosamine transferase